MPSAKLPALLLATSTTWSRKQWFPVVRITVRFRQKAAELSVSRRSIKHLLNEFFHFGISESVLECCWDYNILASGSCMLLALTNYLKCFTDVLSGPRRSSCSGKYSGGKEAFISALFISEEVINLKNIDIILLYLRHYLSEKVSVALHKQRGLHEYYLSICNRFGCSCERLGG